MQHWIFLGLNIKLLIMLQRPQKTQVLQLKCWLFAFFHTVVIRGNIEHKRRDDVSLPEAIT